jgi:hypothetical protein
MSGYNYPEGVTGAEPEITGEEDEELSEWDYWANKGDDDRDEW